MKRIIDYYLQEWKQEPYHRKPLLLRGARQVGKTHAARVLGKTFEHFIEINLEADQGAREIMVQDYDIHRIIFQLSQYLGQEIIPGKTLLFIDEIQIEPKALTALRYFYENMPQLHVIAAGSLLDFAIDQVGLPVGRITSLYMYPLSFLEFLIALDHHTWAQEIINHTPATPMIEQIHKKIIDCVGLYLAIGGMPAAVNAWKDTQNPRTIKKIHIELLDSYQQDFNKYALTKQIKYLDALFKNALSQLGRKFMYSRIGEYQKRELEPAFELLKKAGLVTPIFKTAAQGIPLGSQSKLDDFKVIFLDVGLAQAALMLDISSWFFEPLAMFINKGELVEAFVGQELLAYADPISRQGLFYWRNDNSRSNTAEVDYVIQVNDHIVPLEVKAGENVRIKSMYVFLQEHIQSDYGIRLSAHNYMHNNAIKTYPFYAVASIMLQAQPTIREALLDLVTP